ncbi:Katanin p60 ATPase-containing subunit A-like 2 [Geodia barretti]|uniref:Katanin p60 ATPase-containing subunit A-like 2 n=2 Tax=Geodia barretti TaxID=519541 RepID=A0AA35REN6_GEOBA|nr:Katanin p60 ATPase-containing subunit A-like 2 [Geodia barretti]
MEIANRRMVQSYKLVVLGEGGVGKSAITIQFTSSVFAADYDPTIEDAYRIDADVDGEVVGLDILDTAGQEVFSAVRDRYMRDGEGFILVYSLTERATFSPMSKISEQIKRVKDTDQHIPIVLSDMDDRREVSNGEGVLLSQQLQCPFFETSAKLRINIDECFHELVREIKRSREKQTSFVRPSPCCCIMSAELSYLQLKAANDAREAEEVRVEQRKRNLLVLILHHLREEGFLESAEALVKESGSSIANYQVCDNIDLSTILQEYESYYFVKFKKTPKIIRRATSSVGESRSVKKRLASTRANGADSKSSPCVVSVSSAEELGLTGSAITETRRDRASNSRVSVKGLLQQAIADATSDIPDPAERLLKPVAGFAGYSSEMRELAAVISRDIYLQNPNVHWDDIIGLDAAKRLVKEAVVYPIKYPQLFTGILAPWKGLLLYGPPGSLQSLYTYARNTSMPIVAGTGKTMLAKAVATECKTTFFNISASSIVSKWRGDSEKLVRVRNITVHRSEHEGSLRMKTELLVQMDGLAKSEDLVFVLAASNLPWELDYGMLRRLEKRILVDLPVKSARSAMFAHHLPQTLSQHPLRITTQIDYDQAAELTDGYSGSDIRLVCKEAVMRSVRKVFNRLESLSEGSPASGLEGVVIDPVTMDDIESTVANTKPSARLLASRYTQWQKEYESV